MALRTRSRVVTSPVPSRLGAFGFQSNHMILCELQFSRVFDRHDAFIGWNEAGEDIEQRRLARTGSTRDDDVELGQHADLEEVGDGLGECLQNRTRSGGSQAAAAEFTNGDARPLHRHRPDDRVDARAIRQPRIDQRVVGIDVPSQRRDDPLDDPANMRVILEFDVRLDHFAAALDINAIGAVHHHF